MAAAVPHTTLHVVVSSPHPPTLKCLQTQPESDN